MFYKNFIFFKSSLELHQIWKGGTEISYTLFTSPYT